MNTEKEKKPNVPIMIVATVLLATTALMLTTIENTFAYSSNQAKSDVNECGNGQVPTNIGCQNIDSQIQGDENSVALAGVQTFPEPPVTPPIEPPEETCEGCFDVLTTGQLDAFLIDLAEAFPIDFPDGEATLEELCDIIEALPPENQQIAMGQITEVLQGVSAPNVIDPATITEIIECLERVLGLTAVE